MGEPMEYASSGVDIELEGKAVASLISSLGKSVRAPGTFGAPVPVPGGFGGLIEFGEYYLALATDGVGSKLQIASEVNRFESVGIDCMAMNVNDLLCVGAEPLAFVDYVAVPKPDPEFHKQLGASLSEACRLARVTLAGGETASLPDIVNEVDVSGTALGFVAKGQQITGEFILEDDVLIGLASNGIHSNGYSLVRAVMKRHQHNYLDDLPFERTLPNGQQALSFADVFLIPTSIYCDPIVDMLNCSKERAGFERSDVHGLCHITGGGLTNLLRLHPTFGWTIDSPLPVHAEFDWLQQQGEITDWEMYRTFNMGMGMVIVVSRIVAQDILEWLNSRGHHAQIVGTVHNQGKQVTHLPTGSTYDAY
jgi:phosphoribosylformylglycinamidine cyclo-ligase